MPFEAIDPRPAASARVPADAIVISTRQSGLGARKKYAQMHFGEAIAGKLGIKDGVRLALAWGTGADEGRLKLEVTDGAGHAVKRYRGNGTLYTTIGSMPSWYSGETVKRGRCHAQILEATRGGTVCRAAHAVRLRRPCRGSRRTGRLTMRADEKYPFRSHRSMAEVMAYEARMAAFEAAREETRTRHRERHLLPPAEADKAVANG
ncbi:hypothetical protein [Oceanibaculum indicum]|uniref:Uncharacterized protein n=1 Tax=Oceanibaculum indicum P24 TaxID=1207063 RepID=K2JSJ3_9PROT|nr:hypothetical protein [Oceanibaculum indicum]EKE78453.1 hypothetical protein P24_02796 [Oceanibaculum indicum P24]